MPSILTKRGTGTPMPECRQRTSGEDEGRGGVRPVDHRKLRGQTPWGTQPLASGPPAPSPTPGRELPRVCWVVTAALGPDALGKPATTRAGTPAFAGDCRGRGAGTVPEHSDGIAGGGFCQPPRLLWGSRGWTQPWWHPGAFLGTSLFLDSSSHVFLSQAPITCCWSSFS